MKILANSVISDVLSLCARIERDIGVDPIKTAEIKRRASKIRKRIEKSERKHNI